MTIVSVEESRDSYYDVLRGGIAISAATYADSGTLGAIVVSKNGRPAILTNRHVAYGEEEKQQVNMSLHLILQKAKYGPSPFSPELLKRIQDGEQPIFQPPYRGGLNARARIVAFVTSVGKALDVAVCELVDGVEYRHSIVGEPKPDYELTAIGSPVSKKIVKKSGAKTGLSYGRVNGVEGLTCVIGYYSDFDFWPETAVSDHGDSGAVWADADTNVALALLTGGRYVRGAMNYSTALDMAVLADKFGFRLR